MRTHPSNQITLASTGSESYGYLAQYLLYNQRAHHALFDVTLEAADHLIFARFGRRGEGVTLGRAGPDLVQLPEDIPLVLVAERRRDRSALLHDGEFVLDRTVVGRMDGHLRPRRNRKRGRVVGVVGDGNVDRGAVALATGRQDQCRPGA